MNIVKVKGSHNAMKTGMLAAECAFEALSKSEGQSSTKGMQQPNPQDPHSHSHVTVCDHLLERGSNDGISFEHSLP